MTAPAVLLLYAVLMGTVGVNRLQYARWPQRSPRLGIWVWQSLTASLILAVLLVGATLAVPTLPGVTDLATLFHACLSAFRAHYLTPGGPTVSSVGAALTLLVAGRLVQVLIVHAWVTGRRRLRHRRTLRLVGRRHHLTQTLVVPHPTPTAYCVPGWRGTVVFTSSALAALSPAQADAVLAHERAHLRGRHHLVLAAAEVVRTAFPFVPAFKVASAQLGRLVEMRADDAALRVCERRVLAAALVTLAAGAVPVGAVGAGGTTAFVRARRLITEARPLGLLQTALALAATLVLVATPMLIAAGPAVLATLLHYCPLDVDLHTF